MNNPGPDHVRLVGHQDDGLLPELQLGDLLEDGVRHGQGTLLVNSTDNNKPLWVVHWDQSLQLLPIILSQYQTRFFLEFTEISPKA